MREWTQSGPGDWDSTRVNTVHQLGSEYQRRWSAETICLSRSGRGIAAVEKLEAAVFHSHETPRNISKR